VPGRAQSIMSGRARAFMSGRAQSRPLSYQLYSTARPLYKTSLACARTDKTRIGIRMEYGVLTANDYS